MYQVGQQVVYGIHGVCEILSVEIKTVDRKKISYFVLTPVDQPGARFYVPAENPVALKKISHLLSKQELEALLASVDKSKSAWVEDENRRKLRYKDLLSSGDRKAILEMICASHIHKEEQQQKGKKFHLCDENFLHDAQRLLCSELSLVMEKTREEALAYLHDYYKF